MSPKDPQTATEVGELHVVAVGASAGGLEALEGLFAAFDPPTGMAFVVLQHLSPDFESRMDQLLSRQTSMKVQVVTHGMEVEADQVYLIPPRKEMIISEGRLLLTAKEPARGLTLPIDHFMRSMANDLDTRAVAIILSGSGSDGSRGVREVAAAGGLVLCQEPETARFDSMPRSALATGAVNLALAVEHMPKVLRRYVGENMSPARVAAEVGDVLSAEQRELFRLLRNAYGIDFADYKPTTVERRIERRLGLLRLADSEAYLEHLQSHPQELDELYHDLLIGVTQFFRDPEVYRKLEAEVVPRLFDEAKDRGAELRVWAAGCATGEEAYSLAMLLLEERRRRVDPPELKVFATDVHRVSLESASVGSYSESALANLSAERRRRWFVSESGAHFRVSPELRRCVVFAPHNVVSDAPFTRIDLITCRNLLIYLQPAVQRKVLSLFHFGLRMGGVLLLGSSETPGDLTDEFETIDSRRRLYRKLRDVRIPVAVRSPKPGPRGLARARAAGARAMPDPDLAEVYDVLLGRFMPPALLVDGDYQLLHSFGGAQRYIRMPGGRPTKNLLDLVDVKLKTTFSGALQHAEKEGRSVHYAGLQSEAPPERFDLRVEPVAEIHSGFSGFLLMFELPHRPEAVRPRALGAPAEARSAGSTAPVDSDGSGDSDDSGEVIDADKLSEDYIASLESELRYTRENLQATVEELETSNEELQASNEELQASNEELQSTNEELHSVNEELYTVNSEFQRKIDELSRANADIDNLLEATEVAVVFLDESLCIRRFTSRAAGLFGLLEHDIGREFAGFALQVDDAELIADARETIRESKRISREVRDHKGVRHLLRLLPYVDTHSGADPTRGVLVILVETEEVRRSESRIRRLSTIVESSDDAIISQDLDGVVTTWNSGAASMLGHGDDEMVGQLTTTIVPERLRAQFESHQRRARIEGRVERFECELEARDGEQVEVAVTVTPLLEEGQLVGLSTIARDVRGWNRARERVRNAVQQRESFIAMLSHELRNPLAALLHASRVLDEDVDEGTRAGANESIRRQVEHMARLLDDLLDVSRIRRGKIEMRPERVRVATLVRRVSEAMEAAMSQRGIALLVDLEVPDLVIRVDPDRIRQVLVNLLSNAAKFTPAGREVRLRAYKQEARPDEAVEHLVLSVRDEGVGLTQREIEDIFEPFVQGRQVQEKGGGLGLGLALVKSIIEAHDGSVEARSEGPRRGAEFIVRLPLSSASERELSQPHEHSVAANSGVRPTAIGRRLVLVEDDEDGGKMLATLLRAHGFEVVVAEDGPRGLATILEVEPDVALIDIGLPGMNGLEICRRVRERFPVGSMSLVALTGYGQQSDRQAVFDAGFDHHFVKPVDTMALEAALLEHE